MKIIKINRFRKKEYNKALEWQCAVILKQDYGVDRIIDIPPQMVVDIYGSVTSPDEFYKRIANKIGDKAREIIKKEDYTEDGKEYELLNVQLVDGKLNFLVLNDGVVEVRNDLNKEDYKIISK